MANQGITFKMDTSKAEKRFSEIEKRGKNPAVAMTVISQMAYKQVMTNFDNEQGKRRDWPKWSRKTPKGGRQYFNTRPTKRGGNKLLQDTGTLRLSIRPKVEKDEAHVFTKTKYAGYHQFGTKTIPKRDFLWISQKKINEMAKTFINWLVGK